jgi:hypothetical protein
MKNKLQIRIKQPPDDGKPGYDIFTLWKEYEAIAMHFNDLLLKIRTQSLAAVAAFATIAGVLLKGDGGGQDIRWGALTAVFAGLCVFWVAIWILDFAYYNRLLLGAVKALVWIEKESRDAKRASSIDMSTLIEQSVARRKPAEQADAFDDPEKKAAVLEHPARREDFRLSWGRWLFYGLVFVLLLSSMILSNNQRQKSSATRPKGPPTASSGAT